MRKSRFTTGVLLVSIFMLAAPAFANEQWCESVLTDPPPQAVMAEPSLYLAGKDITILQRIAREQNLLLCVIAPNPEAQKYSFRPGFVAKTSDLKGCKSKPSGTNAGLVQCAPEQYASHTEWLEQKSQLRQMGYTVLGPDQDYLLVRHDGKKMFSDYDLFGVHSIFSGRPVYSEFLRNQINRNLGRRMVRHGPLLEYEHRSVVGLKFPVVCFSPQGIVLSHTREDVAALYKRYGIDIDLNW